MNTYSAMTELWRAKASFFTAIYYGDPKTYQSAGVFIGLAEDPSDIDCGNSLPALEQFFAFALQHRTSEFTLDLSHLTWIEPKSLSLVMDGCAKLSSQYTRISFLEPLNLNIGVNDEIRNELNRLYHSAIY